MKLSPPPLAPSLSPPRFGWLTNELVNFVNTLIGAAVAGGAILAVPALGC